MEVVYVFLIYLFKFTISYSISKRTRVVNKEIGFCLEQTKERWNINYKRGREILPNKRLNLYFMLVKLF
jgi:hypothetical protein